jgi:hypothetical protein
LAALLLTGFALPLLSTAVPVDPRFFDVESAAGGDCESTDPFGSTDVAFSEIGVVITLAVYLRRLRLNACDSGIPKRTTSNCPLGMLKAISVID